MAQWATSCGRGGEKAGRATGRALARNGWGVGQLAMDAGVLTRRWLAVFGPVMLVFGIANRVYG